MARFLPIVLGVLLIVGLTIPQIRMTDRLSGTDFNAEQRAELLNKVPKNVGDWHGEDKPSRIRTCERRPGQSAPFRVITAMRELVNKLTCG